MLGCKFMSVLRGVRLPMTMQRSPTFQLNRRLDRISTTCRALTKPLPEIHITKGTIKIATRRSKLAMTQSEQVGFIRKVASDV